VQFLCREKGFKYDITSDPATPDPHPLNPGFLSSVYSEDRVRNGIHRLEKMLGAKQQGRLDGFFKPMGTVSSKTGSSKAAAADSKGKGGKRKVSFVACEVFGTQVWGEH